MNASLRPRRSSILPILLIALAAPLWGAPAPVQLGWMGSQAPRTPSGVSWGVPFAKGVVAKDQAFTLNGADGNPLPLQSWPLAYWPDGSMKWIGFATVAGPQTTGTLKLSPSAAAFRSDAAPVSVSESADAITINTGALECRIPLKGPNLIESMTIGGKPIAGKGRLVCLAEEGPGDVDTRPPLANYLSDVQKVTIEQKGPIRATIKIDGMHKAAAGSRSWLPFSVRLYFYAGQTQVKMVHTFIFDGDQSKDFIRGLGIVFDVPFRDSIPNRYVRFGGEGNGLWSEPIQPAMNGNEGEYEGARADGYVNAALTAWTDFRLIQPNADGFTVEKRTNAKSQWVAAGAARRASGLVFAGDITGGLGVGVKDFWQTYPKSLEVRNARTAAAELRVWIWSPDAPAMDMRHYDDHAHGLNVNYEDVEMELATPYGIARTTELVLYPASGSLPSRQVAAAQELDAATPPHLMASPQYLHDAKAFGIWSVQNRDTPFKKAVEDQLDGAISYYQKAIDQWNWYGFWAFGNVMHSYDERRHVWRYDDGGWAWDNSEQGTDMWLWYMFLRTGRADIFRMAEAMTRMTGEVIFYHIGPMAGLGIRHGVTLWGDGAKEARISMAPYRRFMYYLTTDERCGDIMREALQADTAITRIDPMRKVLPPTEADKQFKARVRGGPDWFAFAGNWMTEWERTGDTKWRDKIVTGMKSIQGFPYWFRTSQSLLWGFDPETGKLTPRDGNVGGYNLVQNMGGPEVMAELNALIDDPQWTKVWVQYCRMSSAQGPMLKADQATGEEDPDAQFAAGGKMSGYAYYITKNPAYAKKAIGGIIPGGATPGGGGEAGGSGTLRGNRFTNLTRIDGPNSIKAIDEGPGGLLTNTNNNSSLHAIEVLELCADQLPNDIPPPDPNRGGGRAGRGGRGGRGGQRGAAAAVNPAAAAATTATATTATPAPAASNQ